MATISLTLPSDGQTIDASDVNNPFNTIAAEINGNLDNSNIKAGAAIDRSKIAGFTDGWESLNYSPSTVAYNGNRSYDLTFSTVNLTTNISNGMRLKLARSVTPPTQCTDLEAGSSQYFNKTSPAGMTFTDDFVVSAWIKVESYATAVIASRWNGTSGWRMYLESDGRVTIVGYNAGAGNYRGITSYQSVPLNKWVHVAAQNDMSTYTATTTTSYVMIDGVNVPGSLIQAGTNPVALIQAGNLEIGATNGGLSPFDGKIAQVAIYSAKVTQANIQATISQGLTGSESNLISAYSFNNSINDLNTTNANNLTANGSAVATNTDSPFNATEYAIVTANSFATNTTLTVQVPEGYSLPTTGGIGTVSYSTQATPYGFISDKGKWTVIAFLRIQMLKAIGAGGYANLDGAQLNIPAGTWIYGFNVAAQFNPVPAAAGTVRATITTSAGNFNDIEMTAGGEVNVSVNSTGQQLYMESMKSLVLSSATTYYVNIYGGSAGNVYIRGDNAGNYIFAKCAYL